MKSIHYGNSTDEHKELINKRIREEVLVNQSALVGRLFELDMENMTEGLENIEHIECDCCLSIYDDDDLTWSKCPKESGIKGQQCGGTIDYVQQEVLEWWVVTDYMAKRLEETGEPILRTDYGNWWGRTTSGQCLDLDGAMWEVFQHIL